MEVRIIPRVLGGEVQIPPSKSAAHRALICAALAKDTSRISPYCTSDDIKATARCLRALGMTVEEDSNGYTVGKNETSKTALLDFGESGSTARFLLPVAAALGVNAQMTGSGRLPERPLSALTNLLEQHGVSVSSDRLPLNINGKLTAGDFYIAGNVSS